MFETTGVQAFVIPEVFFRNVRRFGGSLDQSSVLPDLLMRKIR